MKNLTSINKRGKKRKKVETLREQEKKKNYDDTGKLITHTGNLNK